VRRDIDQHADELHVIRFIRHAMGDDVKMLD